MIVMTIDQRGSRKGPDLVPTLLDGLNGTLSTHRSFERTAGDEVQGLPADPAEAVRLAVRLAASGKWNVGIGFGGIHRPLPQQTRAGAGPAYEAARRAVERSKKSAAKLAVEAEGMVEEAARLEAELALAALVVARRTPTQTQAALLRDAGWGQSSIAAELGVTQQAISSRLQGALWQEVEDVLGAAAAAAASMERRIDAESTEGSARMGSSIVIEEDKA